MGQRRQEKRKDAKKQTTTPIDPQRQEDLERLADLNTLLSPFWSARSNYNGR